MCLAIAPDKWQEDFDEGTAAGDKAFFERIFPRGNRLTKSQETDNDPGLFEDSELSATVNYMTFKKKRFRELQKVDPHGVSYMILSQDTSKLEGTFTPSLCLTGSS